MPFPLPDGNGTGPDRDPRTPWTRVVLVVLAILIPAFSILSPAGYPVYRAITTLPPTTVVSVVPAPPSAALPSPSATAPPTTATTSRPGEPTTTTTTTTSAAGQQCTGNPPWLNCVP